MYKKSAMYVQSCCFAYKTYCFFGHRPRRWILKSLIITKPERVPDLTKFAKIAKNHSCDEFLRCSRFFAVLCHVNKHKTTASSGLNKICENCKKSSV